MIIRNKIHLQQIDAKHKQAILDKLNYKPPLIDDGKNKSLKEFI